MTATILPANASGLERALDQTGARVESAHVPLWPLWDPHTCPEPLLPWLAWALGLDEWRGDWTVADRREAIRQSVEVHRRKGTVGAIRRALQAAGFPGAQIREGGGGRPYDGSASHDGTEDHAPDDHWAEYRVVLARPVTNADAAVARRIIEAVAPLRCHLREFSYQSYTHSYNATIIHDGGYNHGAAI